MLAIRIEINAGKPRTIGVGADGAAHLVLALTRGRFLKPWTGAAEGTDTGARVTVTGIRISDEVSEQLRWLDFALTRGDRVTLEIVEAGTEEIDTPEVVHGPSAEKREELGRSQIEQLRRQLRELEARYGGE